MNNNMRVQKRNGEYEDVSFDKILNRIKLLCIGEEFTKKLNIDSTIIAQKVCSEIYNDVKTSDLDKLSSEISIALYTTHPDYALLSSRICISNHQKGCPGKFSDSIDILYNNYVDNDHHPIIHRYLYDLVMYNKDLIDSKINQLNDYKLDFFGFKTLEKSYLLKKNKIIIETPQYLFMRVALCIHRHNLDKAFETYNMISNKYFIHATPTLFNSGTNNEQLASCFLLAMKDDSISGIFDTLKDCALISKHAGGIGLHCHNIRAAGSMIKGTNGISNGLVPMLRVFNDTARYVDQCVKPETIIYTTEGPKEIQYCELNKTCIFTTKGPEIIQNILEHPYQGYIKKIYNTHSLEPLEITLEHPVYCLKNQQKNLNYSVIKNRLNKNLIEPEWCEAKDLTTDDLLIFSKPEYEVDNINLTEDDCYIYGLILGDGCMNQQSTSCYISFNTITKNHIKDFIKEYLESKCVEYYLRENNNCSRIYWSRNIILPFRYFDIYDENKEKKINHKWLNLPINKSKYIIKGLIDTDGCKGNELVFDSTSRNLIESLRYLLLRMNIPTSGYIRDRVGESHISKFNCEIINKKISYCLRIPKTKEISELLNIESGKFFKFFTHNDLIYSRINKIEDSQYNGILYDLQMKDTHNYMIHNGYIHNGGGKRNGSIAIYLEPWHADIMEFLELKKNHGNELEKARDLFYGLWIPDLFMKRVQENGNWTLMCPNECPGLSDCYGEEFEKLYIKYEQEGRGKTIEAQKVWHSIYISQIEVGMPYILFKDACNKKSNQNNLGTIKSSNLCTEIIEYSDKDETAVCNLASISLTNLIEHKNITDNITIYSKSNCSQCDYIKNIMNNRNINYTEIKLDNKSDRIKLYQKIDSEEDILVEIMPQIYINDNYLGGFLELYDYIKPEFNYDKLEEIVGILTLNLNNIIDNNYYPLEETKRSNFRHRPIGIGVQGLANVFYEMGVSFDSNEAKKINEKIFEHIYYGSLKKSMEISKEREELFIKLKSYMHETDGLRFPEEYYTLKDEIGCTQEELDKLFNTDKYYGSYLTFEGSPASQGLLQFDLWDSKPSDNMLDKWNELKENIIRYGLRNSLCVAPMPTASTSQILGNYECFEPVMSNIYTRRVLAGEYVVINNYLINDLIHYGIWNKELKDKIIVNDGSIQTINEIPKFIKDRYKTGWEIKQKNIIDMSVDRGKYICQSQSLNLFIEAPTFKTISSMHFYSWKKGLKTGIYYLRSRPSSKAIQFTVAPEVCENCSG
uniref:ribonucleoside-diphosphate reductase n=1 Tax=viral metagenome TaxID=1070528 RepID=A0A6C0C6T3_9ZZZZ